MALVTLVVIGHSWTLLPDSALDNHLYDFLYAWHVPAFVLVTGYLSRSFAWDRVRLWRLVRTVAVPYLLFETAFALFRIYVGGERLEDLFTDPHWPLWYLSALFFWRLLTPLFRPMWGGLVVAIVISLVAGLRAGDTLDLARVLGLLPFFVMGLKTTPEHLELLRRRPARIAGAGILAGILVLTTWTDRFASTEWLYYRSQYGELEASDTRAFVVRAALLVIGTLGAWSFLALVPRTGGWFARMGAATLVVYLFHGFVVKSVQYAGLPGWVDDHPAGSLALATLASVGVALVLAWAPVSSRLTHLVDPLGFAEGTVRDAMDLTVAGAAEGVVDLPAAEADEPAALAAR
jgi:fucose 4-O-acetylase-like acetyltransferase